MATDLHAKITSLVTDTFEDESLFIVDINVSGSEEGMKKILILVDSDSSIRIDQCASISRQVSNQIEELDLISTAFIIEVSSPGLDRPITLLRQYQKNVGEKVEITLNDGKVKVGKIESINPDVLQLAEEVPNKANKKKIDIVSVQIPFEDIKKTIKVVSFK